MGFFTNLKRATYLTTEKKSFLLTILILTLIYCMAFLLRLFSVLRFESVIHEFDPYFNFRSTTYLVKNGWFEFYNWFDNLSWYPLGRIVGGTVYPGIQITAYLIYKFLHLFNFTVALRNVCVLTAPFFAANTAMVAYFLGKFVKGRAVGLLSAAMVAIIPGYISRSVAGSFDNEGVAIFALLITFTLFLKSLRTGSMMWSTLTCIAYFYMVNAWGGYIFILNLIPVYVMILIFFGFYSHRLYVAYSCFYALGTLLSMQVRFVGFQAVQTGEHMGALGVFLFIQFYCFVLFLRSKLSPNMFKRLVYVVISTAIISFVVVFFIGTLTGYISPWSGRFYVMLDPTYAKKHIPIIASVSEHQPTTWASYFFDLHLAIFLFPVGIYYCIKDSNEMSIFIMVYGMFSVYFAGVMVRLVLVLAPAAAILSALAISNTLYTFMGNVKRNMKELSFEKIKGRIKDAVEKNKSDKKKKKKSKKLSKKAEEIPTDVSAVMVIGIFFLLILYVFHCVWVTSEAYSSPSIVLAARGPHGRIIYDDFREAYFWLSQNTPEDAKVMSWWDYGYQIIWMSNRTTIVDNNTWNNSHIATVGRAMSSPEDKAFHIMKNLDVSYVLVIFGGVTGFASDDINKFLWMVRIGGSVYPEIKEPDYLSGKGEYRIDAEGSTTMLNCLMYKMCFYRFGEMMTEQGQPSGYDRVRRAEIGKKNFELEYIEEVFSSEHFLVRIYKVKDYANLASNNKKFHMWPEQ